MNEAAIEAYEALDPKLRRAALFALTDARRTCALRWPTAEIIHRYAKQFGVPLDHLAGIFGFRVFGTLLENTVLDNPTAHADVISEFGLFHPSNPGFAFHELGFGEFAHARRNGDSQR